MAKIKKVPGGFVIVHSTNNTTITTAATRAEANQKLKDIHKRNGVKPKRRTKRKKRKKSNTRLF